jgi:hypothetical protein
MHIFNSAPISGRMNDFPEFFRDVRWLRRQTAESVA